MKKQKANSSKRASKTGAAKAKSRRSRVSDFGKLGKVREISLNELESVCGDLEQSVGYPPPSPSPAGPSPSQ